MRQLSITPSITVTIGRHTRQYFAFVTTAPAQLDSPATVTDTSAQERVRDLVLDAFAEHEERAAVASGSSYDTDFRTSPLWRRPGRLQAVICRVCARQEGWPRAQS